MEILKFITEGICIIHVMSILAILLAGLLLSGWNFEDALRAGTWGSVCFLSFAWLYPCFISPLLTKIALVFWGCLSLLFLVMILFAAAFRKTDPEFDNRAEKMAKDSTIKALSCTDTLSFYYWGALFAMCCVWYATF